MDTTSPQDRRAKQEDGNREDFGHPALVYDESGENHQRDHNHVEEKAAGKSRLAERCYYENDDGQ